jgi:hypothetical protein
MMEPQTSANAASQSLVFSPSPTSVSIAITFVAVVAFVAWMAWRRSGFRLPTGLLEGLRVLIAIGIAVTLNQPEWREVFKPESKPTLLILHDISHSMETRDIIDTKNPAAGIEVAR